MGMSNLTDLLGGEQAGGPAPDGVVGDPTVPDPSPKKNFGQRLGDFAQDRIPVASGLADRVFGNQASAAPGGGVAPVASDMVADNAKPKEGGGLAALIKLFAGG